jgi:hypothetical protein
MEKKSSFAKILNIAGSVLVWFTLLVPILLSMLHLIRAGEFRFDFLIPAELFPVALGGGSLLLWAALRARRRSRLIGVSLGIALLSLVGGQALAIATGLASGATEPGGWQWVLVLATIVIYTLALVVLGVGGVLLGRDLWRKLGDEVA